MELVCLLCSYYCKLKDGQIGIYGVNKNVGDKIECLVYGHYSALNNDPIEKKPLITLFLKLNLIFWNCWV